MLKRTSTPHDAKQFLIAHEAACIDTRSADRVAVSPAGSLAVSPARASNDRHPMMRTRIDIAHEGAHVARARLRNRRIALVPCNPAKNRLLAVTLVGLGALECSQRPLKVTIRELFTRRDGTLRDIADTDRRVSIDAARIPELIAALTEAHAKARRLVAPEVPGSTAHSVTTRPGDSE
jgi:hypothetical protein